MLLLVAEITTATVTLSRTIELVDLTNIEPDMKIIIQSLSLKSRIQFNSFVLFLANAFKENYGLLNHWFKQNMVQYIRGLFIY